MTVQAPEWLIREVRQARRDSDAGEERKTGNLLKGLGLSTVCLSARCPNRRECFSHQTATFLILGEICTRHCTFCAVEKGRVPAPPSIDEPNRLAQALGDLGIGHAVITSVTRDDLPDGGAAQFAATVRTIRERCPAVTVELLVPDFAGSAESLTTVLLAQPDILAHNLETVPRLYPKVRSGANYHRSLDLLFKAKERSPDVTTKSGFMVGLGEAADEVESVLRDLQAVGCDMVTIGQYLAPSSRHLPVSRYVTPEEFDRWQQRAGDLGFKSIAAGPLIRSSYNAASFFEGLQQKGTGGDYGLSPRS